MTTLTNEQLVAEFYWSLRAIKEATGVTPKCWRPVSICLLKLCNMICLPRRSLSEMQYRECEHINIQKMIN
jgi:hypothetical protein